MDLGGTVAARAKRGFAARVAGSGRGPQPRGFGAVRRPAQGGSPPQGAAAGTAPAAGAAVRRDVPGAAPSGRRRAKALSAVAAASVAVAFMGVAYGGWAVASSHAAVEGATAGAMGVVVAASDIQAGSAVSSASFAVKDIPAAYRAEGALDEAAFDAAGIADGQALVDIPAGTQIVPSFLTSAGENGHVATQLAAGMEAVTLAVDAETGLAGQVRPLDTVRVVAVEGASAGASLLSTLCERARVVSVGGASADGSSYTSVTVEVSPSEADSIREAQYMGRVSVVLVSAADALQED